MDFNSLAVGSPFYILQKADKPSLKIATVRKKGEPKSAYPTQTQGIMQGLGGIGNNAMVVDVVVSVDGTEIPFNNLPSASESTTYNGGNTFVSSSKEATLQTVDAMMQSSKKALEMMDYHKTVMEVGEGMLELLNPAYAEGKQQARTIIELRERMDAQDKKMDKILSRFEELFAPPKK